MYLFEDSPEPQDAHKDIEAHDCSQGIVEHLEYSKFNYGPGIRGSY